MRLLNNRKYFCPIQKSGNVKLFDKKSKDQMDNEIFFLIVTGLPY